MSQRPLGPVPRASARPRPRLPRPARLLLPVLAAALAVPLLTAAHQARPTPYGDRLTTHAPGADPDPALRIRALAVEAHDPAAGRVRWTYTRTGHRPLAVRAAPGHAFALWDDGLVTDTVRADGSAVRWHRAIPAFDGRPDGVLQPLDAAARMLAVVTPHHVAGYRTADGDLRWVLPAAPGCSFAAHRHVRRTTGPSYTLLLAQPCGGSTVWSEELVAVDALGRITPDRNPLGNGPAAGAEGPARASRGAGPRKAIAQAR
ncbi:hypothetical protein ACFYVL_37395 [Streptomyces sp. NPDC004111]|uniref:hypothetical protein n=1 Tax=Streptomyces sp. NPDC004111 TaxID=3364690 RepID=UPI0036BC0BA1